MREKGENKRVSEDPKEMPNVFILWKMQKSKKIKTPTTSPYLGLLFFY